MFVVLCDLDPRSDGENVNSLWNTSDSLHLTCYFKRYKIVLDLPLPIRHGQAVCTQRLLEAHFQKRFHE